MELLLGQESLFSIFKAGVALGVDLAEDHARDDLSNSEVTQRAHNRFISLLEDLKMEDLRLD